MALKQVVIHSLTLKVISHNVILLWGHTQTMWKERNVTFTNSLFSKTVHQGEGGGVKKVKKNVHMVCVWPLLKNIMLGME